MKKILVAAGLLFSQAVMADDWRTMDTAPHDGTTIEIKNTWGIAPWYDIFRWDVSGWKSVDRKGHGIVCDLGRDSCHWRPYAVNGQTYVDPTGGAQFTDGYWRSYSNTREAAP